MNWKMIQSLMGLLCFLLHGIRGQSVSNITSIVGNRMVLTFDLREALNGVSSVVIKMRKDLNTVDEVDVAHAYRNGSGVYCQLETDFKSCQCDIDDNLQLTLVIPTVKKEHEGWYEVYPVPAETDSKFSSIYLKVSDESVNPKMVAGSQLLSQWLFSLFVVTYLWALMR